MTSYSLRHDFIHGLHIYTDVSMIIPDYLIIDEIRRRRERAWQPETIKLPLPSYDVPNEDMEYPKRSNPEPQKPNNNGVIIIDLNNNKRII